MVFSDFRHGIFNRRHHSPADRGDPAEGAFKVADSQVASRWGNILEFQGFDLITPNEREARLCARRSGFGVRPLALEPARRANCKTLILKLGDRGMHHLPRRLTGGLPLVLRRRYLRRARGRRGGRGRCAAGLCHARDGGVEGEVVASILG